MDLLYKQIKMHLEVFSNHTRNLLAGRKILTCVFQSVTCSLSTPIDHRTKHTISLSRLNVLLVDLIQEFVRSGVRSHAERAEP